MTQPLAVERINWYFQAATQSGSDVYWQVLKPPRTLKLTWAANYVGKIFPNFQGNYRFVYWPDYVVAGTIADIINTFQNAGLDQIRIGALYQLTNGQLGQVPGTAELDA